MSASTKHSARLVGGLDSGLTSGGFVVIDRARSNRVLAAYSLVEARGDIKNAKEAAQGIAERHFGGWSDLDFLPAVLRAQAWMAKFIAALDDVEVRFGPVDVFGVESFVDQPQHAKKMLRNRWQTPLVMGLQIGELSSRGATPENGRVVYQDAGLVLKQFSDERARLEARRTNDRDLVVPGDRQVTNGHQRSALCHALALSLRLPRIPQVAAVS